jgi:hypothetical protein
MSQLKLKCQTAINTLEVEAINSLEEITAQNSSRCSPSKNCTVSPWLQTDQNLNHIYSKKIKSPAKLARPQSVTKHYEPLILIKKMSQKADQSTQAVDKMVLPFTNFLISKESHSNYTYHHYRANARNKSLIIKKDATPLTLNTSLLNNRKKPLVIQLLNNTFKQTAKEGHNYADKVALHPLGKKKNKKAMKLNYMPKGKENNDLFCKKIDPMKNSSCVYFI